MIVFNIETSDHLGYVFEDTQTLNLNPVTDSIFQEKQIYTIVKTNVWFTVEYFN